MLKQGWNNGKENMNDSSDSNGTWYVCLNFTLTLISRSGFGFSNCRKTGRRNEKDFRTMNLRSLASWRQWKWKTCDSNKRIIEDTESYMSSQNFHSSRAEIRWDETYFSSGASVCRWHNRYRCPPGWDNWTVWLEDVLRCFTCFNCFNCFNVNLRHKWQQRPRQQVQWGFQTSSDWIFKT